MKKLLIILCIAFSACGMQSHLNRTLVGKDLSQVEQYLKMKVSHVYEIGNGQSKAVFTKKESLRATTISQGKGTLDPITSPSVDKTEHFIFILDQNGKVLKSEYEKQYQRR